MRAELCLNAYECLPKTQWRVISDSPYLNSMHLKSLKKNTHPLNSFSDPPITPNPSTENSNATSILLKWSPPFLWPGYSIDYYNISITNNGSITYSHALNATFKDVLVSFLTFAEDSDIQSCHVLKILLSAVSSDAEDLTTYHVNGGFIPST